MKQTVNEYDFIDAFKRMDREENFSYEGLSALFDFLEQLEEDTGEEMELDVIAICCDFCEYANLEDFRNDYGDEYQTLEDVENETTVIRIDDTRFIIQAF